jgi:membrane protein
MVADENGSRHLQRWLRQPSPPGWRGWPRNAARIVYGIAADIAGGTISNHAASLTYTTLLSLVPMLALTFSVLKGLGAAEAMRTTLSELLRPLGDNAKTIDEILWSFVGNVDASVLGAVGLGLLAYTAISVVQKIEAAFNESWQVRQGRSWGRKFTDYLSVLMVGPLLAAAAIGLLASLRARAQGAELADYPPLQHAAEQLLALAPFGLLIVAFTALYAFLPNTRVRLFPAVGAAIIAALLWLAAGWVFTTFVAMATSYTAIYSAFAALVLFLLWLNVNWTIVLIGADVAFHLQYPHHLKGRESAPAPADAERLGLVLVAEIVRRLYAGRPPPRAHDLARITGEAEDRVTPLLKRLSGAGLVSASGDHPPRDLLARAADATSVATVLRAIRGNGEAVGPRSPAVDRWVSAVDAAIQSAAGQAPLTALLERPVTPRQSPSVPAVGTD